MSFSHVITWCLCFACRFTPGQGESVFERDQAIAKKAQVMEPNPDDRFLCSFAHIFAGGYSAGRAYVLPCKQRLPPAATPSCCNAHLTLPLKTVLLLLLNYIFGCSTCKNEKGFRCFGTVPMLLFAIPQT